MESLIPFQPSHEVRVPIFFLDIRPNVSFSSSLQTTSGESLSVSGGEKSKQIKKISNNLLFGIPITHRPPLWVSVFFSSITMNLSSGLWGLEP